MTPAMKTRWSSTGLAIALVVALAAGAATVAWWLLAGHSAGGASGIGSLVADPEPSHATTALTIEPSLPESKPASRAAIRRRPFRDVAESGPAKDPEPYAVMLRFDVRVEDAAGRPVGGVPLVVVGSEPEFDPRRPDRGGPVRGVSAPDGTATLSARMPRQSPTSGVAGPHPDFGFPYERKAPPPEPGSDGTTVLAMPPVGYVKLDITDGRDRSIRPNSFVVAESEDNPVAMGGAPLKIEPQSNGSTPEGGPVGLGLKLRATVGSRELGYETVAFDGPKQPGETVAVRIKFGASSQAFRARLLTADGAPAANKMVALTRQWETGASAAPSHILHMRGQTDPQGFVTMTVDVGPIASEGALLAYTIKDGAGRWIARKRIGEIKAVEVYDLGELVLEEDVPMIAGGVLNADGKVAEDVRVAVSYARRDLEAASPGISAQVGMRRDSLLSVDYDKETGAFAVYGPGTPWPLVVTATAPGYPVAPSATATATAGDRSIALVLGEAPGYIVGSVALGELSEHLICIGITPSAPRSDVPSSQLSVSADGLFATDPMPPGVYDVAVLLGPPMYRSPTALLVRDVTVKSGETTEDPRLRDIDLRGRYRRVVFTIVDEQNKPVERPTAEAVSAEDEAAYTAKSSSAAGGARMRIRGELNPADPAVAGLVAESLRAGGLWTPHFRARTWQGRELSAGRVSLLLPDTVRTVRIADRGQPRPKYRPVILQDVDGDRRVVLRPRLLVRLEASAEAQLPGGDRLVPKLLVVEDLPEGEISLHQELDATMAVPTPGEYVVEWWRQSADARGTTRLSIATKSPPEQGLRPTTITVADTDVEQVFTLTPPAALLKEIAERSAASGR